jgi:hypothetical protein
VNGHIKAKMLLSELERPPNPKCFGQMKFETKPDLKAQEHNNHNKHYLNSKLYCLTFKLQSFLGASSIPTKLQPYCFHSFLIFFSKIKEIHISYSLFFYSASNLGVILFFDDIIFHLKSRHCRAVIARKTFKK